MDHTGGAWLSSARVVRCWVKSLWPGLHTYYNGDHKEQRLGDKKRIS